MTNGVDLSIIVPVYNTEKYLDQCLSSIVHQSISNIEIICINDGSTDSSPAILEKYSENDERIRIINKKNSGYGAAINIGIDTATGKYIGIVESDDFVDEKMFETLVTLAEQKNLDIARSEFYYYDDLTKIDIKSNMFFSPHNCVVKPRKTKMVFYQQPSIWANIYKRKFLNNNKIRCLETPGASYQDTSFAFKTYYCAKRYEMIDDAFIHYRQSKNSSTSSNDDKIYCICDEFLEIERFLKSKHKFKKESGMFMHLKINAYKWNYERLKEPYNAMFLKKWREELVNAKKNRYLNINKFNKKDATLLRKILNEERINE